MPSLICNQQDPVVNPEMILSIFVNGHDLIFPTCCLQLWLIVLLYCDNTGVITFIQPFIYGAPCAFKGREHNYEMCEIV